MVKSTLSCTKGESVCSLVSCSNRFGLCEHASQRNCRYTFARGRQGIFEALSEALVISEEMERYIQNITRSERSQGDQDAESQNIVASNDAKGDEGMKESAAKQ